MSRSDRSRRLAAIEARHGAHAGVHEAGTAALAWLVAAHGGRHPERVARIEYANKHDRADLAPAIVDLIDAAGGDAMPTFMAIGSGRMQPPHDTPRTPA